MIKKMTSDHSVKNFFFGSFQTAFGIILALITVWIILKITTSQGYDSLRDVETDKLENPLNEDKDFE